MNETDPNKKESEANSHINSNALSPSKASVAFYNLENLFDTEDDPDTLDDDFTPEGYKNWNPKRYKNKLRKLSSVISKIGASETQGPPSLLGVAEVENLFFFFSLT